MSLFDTFSFRGKRVLVVGAATGMGAAAAALAIDAGADVIALDRADFALPGATVARIDLADKASIEDAAASLTGPFDALMSCAGVADGTPGIEKINFLGHRHFIDCLLQRDLLARGSAIGLISSFAGAGWDTPAAWPSISAYLDLDFDAATAWAIEKGKADYRWAKQSVNAYVAREAFTLLKRGIRINAILPGPTDTPLAQANAATWLGFGADYRAETGIEPSTPSEQAGPLLFLCSDAAKAITGVTLVTDAGYMSAGITGSFPPAARIVNFMTGRG